MRCSIQAVRNEASPRGKAVCLVPSPALTVRRIASVANRQLESARGRREVRRQLPFTPHFYVIEAFNEKPRKNDALILAYMVLF